MSWNVGGAGSSAFIRALKFMVTNHKPNILILLEPQINGEVADRVCGKMGFPNIMRVEAEGRKGGIWLCWDANSASMELVSACFQHLTVRVSTSGVMPWLLTAVYASPRQEFHRFLWQAIFRSGKEWDLPRLLTGDFNAIRSPSEQTGRTTTSTYRRCKRFSERIEQAGLIDLGYSGPCFTWTRGDQSTTYKASRIDRSLCNTTWNSAFPNTFVQHLPRIHSDHHPILTTVNNQGVSTSTSRPFRFEGAWLTHDSYANFLSNSWDSQAPLQDALKKLAGNLVEWNQTTFGNILHRKKRLLGRIHGIQTRVANGFSPGLYKLQKKLEKELDDVLEQEEILWYQRSRENWVKFGERNTAYFHQQAIIRRRRNRIASLKASNGEWISDPQELAALVFDFFSLLYLQDDQDYTDGMPSQAFPRLTQEEMLLLLRPFTGADIQRAVQDMKPFQAPGPDGFQAIFFQRSWQVVGKALIDLAMDFFSTGVLPEEVVESTVVLIPKVDHPELVSQLRPISLNNVCLKAITKAITNRLKPIMRKFVSPRQSSFIPGRQTTDNIIVLQEVLHSLRKRKGKKGGMVLKIDLEKAYDRLRWEFLRDTLKEVGLPSSWINCIMFCVEHNRMRLLWNGELSAPIIPSRGVRQGDPLSPYLFVLCMERLSHRIDQAIQDGLWKPLRLSKNGPLISHLFFADDLILFAETGGNQVRIIKQCLDEFCHSSGQRVNYNKSAIFVSANIDRRRARRLASRAEIPLTVDIGRYLGVMAIHGRVTKSRYQDLMLRIQRKLAPWKAKHLSLAARITVVKSISASIPIYPMQTELLPMNVCRSLDRINRSFIWGDTEARKKLHLVGWPQLLKPKDKGGLGIRSTREVNLSMLAKGGWRILQEKDNLWVQMVRAKYGGNREHLDLLRPVQGSSFTWASFTKAADLLKKGCAWNIHRENQTKFWMGIWLLQVPLHELATDTIPEDDRMAAVADFVDEEGNWRVEKFENLLPQEIQQLITAHAVDPLSLENDRLFWSPTTDGRFSTRSAYQLLQPGSSGDHQRTWKAVWRLQVPERVRCFIWLVAQEKISSNEFRTRRHLAQDGACYRCENQLENLDHIFRRCPPAAFLWHRTVPSEDQTEFFSWEWEEWLERNLTSKKTTSSGLSWDSFFSIALWCLWKNKNEGTFEGLSTTLSAPSLMQSIMIRAELWTQAWNAPSPLMARGVSTPSRTMTEIGWKPPPTGWVKINVYGAASGSQGPAEAGGTVRDASSAWLGGFVSSLGTCSAALAELWAIYHGLKLGWNLGHRTLIIESDSQVAIQLVNNRLDPLHPYASILSAIRRKIAQDWVVSLVHTYREGNRVADWLSKHSLVYPYGMYVLDSPPPELLPLLQDDSNGVTLPRSIVNPLNSVSV
ncbi:unnamed protein product [Linum trigynum]|uniref:Uncharacterized protein n=1 Tax=Linum trigynum TaxID=586398 RepID=A0AAV2CXW7_9ROSI